MGFASFSTKLQTILAGLVGAGKTYAAAYGFFNPEPIGYPYLVITPQAGSKEERLTTIENKLFIRYQILGIWKTDNELATETAKATAIDEVLALLRKKTNVDTLDGEVNRFDIESIDPVETETSEAVTGFRITVIGMVVTDITL